MPEDYSKWDVPQIKSSNADLRECIRGILKAWSDNFPGEVRAAKEYIRRHKESQRDGTGKTPEGEHVIGAMPAKVAAAIAYFLDDPHWLWNNPDALGIVFDEFEIGRLAYWTGTGREGAGASKLTLNEADRK